MRFKPLKRLYLILSLSKDEDTSAGLARLVMGVSNSVIEKTLTPQAEPRPLTAAIKLAQINGWTPPLETGSGQDFTR
jgi:hypothetical protein